MHSDIIKSVSRLITEREHTISSALVGATSNIRFFTFSFPSSSRGQYRQTEPPPSLHTYEHTNTTCDCFLPAGAAGNSWEIGDGSEMCTAVWREFKHGNQCKGGGGGDTVMCVCVCVWTSERCGSSADNPNLTLSAARWAVFAEIKHIFRATLTAGA